MHSYLRSIGFLNYTQKEFDHFLYEEAILHPDETEVGLDYDGNEIYELRKEVSKNMGIAIRGAFHEGERFMMDYYFPYRIPHTRSNQLSTALVRQSDRNSLSGVCEDDRLGVDLIFFVQDMMHLLNSEQREQEEVFFGGVHLMGLSMDGKILLPVDESRTVEIRKGEKAQARSEMISAARSGDESAFEALTIDDMDTYSEISKRIEFEDMYSIIHTSFMPSGIESDKYFIIGEILSCVRYINQVSMQTVYEMTVACNNMQLDVCINEKDLLGEPAIGRRFKGEVWLQGLVCRE